MSVRIGNRTKWIDNSRRRVFNPNVAAPLLAVAEADCDQALARLATSRDGLGARDAARRLRSVGLNRIVRERRPGMA
jgi:hypothetical protein